MELYRKPQVKVYSVSELSLAVALGTGQGGGVWTENRGREMSVSGG